MAATRMDNSDSFEDLTVSDPFHREVSVHEDGAAEVTARGEFGWTARVTSGPSPASASSSD